MTDDHHDHDGSDDHDPHDDLHAHEASDWSARVDARITRLREDLDFLLMVRDSAPVQPAIDSSWQAMPAGRAADAWPELIDWVDELVDRYALDETIPTCWYTHGPMVEELHDLHLAWLGAYSGRPDPADRAVWHDLLERVIHRLRAWNRHGCTPSSHRPDEPALPSDDERYAPAAYIDRDVRARHAANQRTFNAI